jgi:hypothetical protein
MRDAYLSVIESLDREAVKADLTGRTYLSIARTYTNKADELRKKVKGARE